jgi:hypothetical protein
MNCDDGAYNKLFTQYGTEVQCSLLCSQEPSIGPYSESDESSSYQAILFL